MELWRAVVPLICFNIVEWHQPDRVMRQFGMVQHIPYRPSQPQNLHDLTLRGKTSDNWETKLASGMQTWLDRYQYVWTNPPQIGLLSANNEYMRWYNRITRRWILRDGAMMGKMYDVHERLWYLSSPEGQPSFTFEEMTDLVKICLQLHSEDHRIFEAGSVAPQPTQEARISEEHIQVVIPQSRREDKGLQRGRTKIQAEVYTLPPMLERQEGIYHVPQYPLCLTQSSSSSSTYYHSSQPHHNEGGSSSSRGVGGHDDLDLNITTLDD